MAIITIKLDVRKLDKSRFFEGKADASGHKPLYADLVLIPRKEVGKYGDTHIVKQSKKKDEDVEMPIIGNATDRGSGQRAPQQSQQGAPSENLDEDVPF